MLSSIIFISQKYFFLTFHSLCDLISLRRFEMDNINSRICRLITELSMTKTSFAKALNLSQPFVSNICAGASQPSERTILDICREFNVNEQWLRSGEGDMFLRLSRNDEIAAYVARVMKDESAYYQQKMLLFFSRLSPEMLRKLEEVAKDILSEPKKEQKD